MKIIRVCSTPTAKQKIICHYPCGNKFSSEINQHHKSASHFFSLAKNRKAKDSIFEEDNHFHYIISYQNRLYLITFDSPLPTEKKHRLKNEFKTLLYERLIQHIDSEYDDIDNILIPHIEECINTQLNTMDNKPISTFDIYDIRAKIILSEPDQLSESLKKISKPSVRNVENTSWFARLFCCFETSTTDSRSNFHKKRS